MLKGKAQEEEDFGEERGFGWGGGNLSEREMVRDSNEAVLQVPEGKKWELGETW